MCGHMMNIVQYTVHVLCDLDENTFVWCKINYSIEKLVNIIKGLNYPKFC